MESASDELRSNPHPSTTASVVVEARAARHRSDDAYRTGDDRPASLQADTRDWGTDWALHSVPYTELRSGGVPRDGIPALDRPRAVSIAEAMAWLDDREPVIAVVVGEAARAYPLLILTWHEIANDSLGGVPLAVTFCPLCNSALAFDRRLDGRVLDFGVSGLLRHSDLIMWDRQTESLWQQLDGSAIAGAYTGARLDLVPSLLLSWADFRATYPQGDVLSRETGHRRDYGANPYLGYDTIGRRPFLFGGSIDARLQGMERVVAIAQGAEALAIPYGRLAEARVINDQVGGQPVVVFWKPGTASALDTRAIAEGRDVGSAAVFDPRVDRRTLSFGAHGEGRFRDTQTGSTWTHLGRAIDGPLAGTQLDPLVHGHPFWFAWSAIAPQTRLWEAGGSSGR